MSKDNGGPAYPSTQYAQGISPSGHSEGMTLRDYFAAAAAQGIMANDSARPESAQHFANIAEDAYILADAMLAERTK